MERVIDSPPRGLSRTTAGIVVGIIEVAAFAALAVLALAPAEHPQPSGPEAAGDALLGRLHSATGLTSRGAMPKGAGGVRDD